MCWWLSHNRHSKSTGYSNNWQHMFAWLHVTMELAGCLRMPDMSSPHGWLLPAGHPCAVTTAVAAVAALPVTGMEQPTCLPFFMFQCSSLLLLCHISRVVIASSTSQLCGGVHICAGSVVVVMTTMMRTVVVVGVTGAAHPVIAAAPHVTGAAPLVRGAAAARSSCCPAGACSRLHCQSAS
jgi:hypothetical protein